MSSTEGMFCDDEGYCICGNDCMTPETGIQCHQCGWHWPHFICGQCLIPLSVPVQETWEDWEPQINAMLARKRSSQ